MPRSSVARVAFAVTLTTVSVLLVPLVGTGCSSSDPPSEEGTGRTSQALEAGAHDATMALDATLADAPEDGAATCRRVEIVASKTYAPARFVDGEMAFTPPITFKLPSEIAVIEGNAGNHWMTLRFHKLGTDNTFRCRYRGGARNANPNNPTERAKGLKYLWEWCDNPALSEPGDGIATDLITLRVDNGSIQDPAGKTTVRFVADEAAPCAGETRDASVDANDAADAAPDVQDASESGAQDASLDGADATDSADAGDADDEGDADTGPACTAALCDDANPCTEDTCSASGCAHAPVAVGTSCADGNACNGAEQCNAQGACTAGVAPVLDDGNVCTLDACDPVVGVTHAPVAQGTACSDGNACNGSEICSAQGTCVAGAAPVVDDGNPCTSDTCSPTSGVTHASVAAGTSCSDGNACNGGETCDALGACAAGAAPVVDDGNPCTVDACSPSGGMTHTPAAVGTSCSNGNVCDGTEACDGAGACLAGSAPVVDDGNACTVDACSPSGGVTHTPVAAGTACSDGNACNGFETCGAQGACSAGVPPVVDDGNPCTIDACSPSGGVTHTPAAVGTSCSNGDACDGAEVCNGAGTCAAGMPVLVDDGNACTLDSCDPARGVVHTPAATGSACSDGNLCNGMETCNAVGACTAGLPLAVDDSNPCTADRCDAVLGVLHAPTPEGSSCSDGNACNGAEFCNGLGGCAAGAPVGVDDGNACTVDACDPVAGVTHAPVASGTSCSNGNACDGTETCNAAGTCQVGVPPILDDNDGCTADACSPSGGVTHVPVAGCTRIPPDPATVAPPIDPTVPTDIAAAYGFLFTGANAIQSGVATGTIDARRMSILRGTVQLRDGAGVPSMRVSILGHPELGQTFTRADGRFTMAINGGGPLTVQFDRFGYLPVQRRVDTGWRDHVNVPTVVVLPYDATVAPVQLGASAPEQIARGSQVTDSDGTRQATLFFPPGTEGVMHLPDGSTMPLSSVHFRATEYTVGATGPQAMPGTLPPTSAYTYAVAFDFDEAVTASATSVEFNKDVSAYVDNFLSMPVGVNVPSGYYDRAAGVWRASEDGRVIRVVDVVAGVANLDTNGDGQADSDPMLAALGITLNERTQLGTFYTAGKTLWRVPIRHFTDEDFNYPGGPPPNAIGPNGHGPRDPNGGGGTTGGSSSPNGDGINRGSRKPGADDDENEQCGSVIGCESQTLGEDVALAGTSAALHYRSDRTKERKDAYRVRIPVTGASALPDTLKRIDVRVEVAGRKFEQSFAPARDLSWDFTWDGKDFEGRVVRGITTARVHVGFIYPLIYLTPDERTGLAYNSFGLPAYNGIPMDGSAVRQEVELSEEWAEKLGTPNFDRLGIPDWSLTPHHVYDPTTHQLYRGDGSRRTASSVGTLSVQPLANPIAATPVASPPMILAVAVGSDGSRYFALALNQNLTPPQQSIVRVRPDGTLSTLLLRGAGLVNSVSWDRNSIAIGPDDSVYIAAKQEHRILRVSPTGALTIIAGTGVAGMAGQGGPATSAQVSQPDRIAVAADGTVYFHDWTLNGVSPPVRRLSRIGSDGVLVPLMSFSGPFGPGTAPVLDGVPASKAYLSAGGFLGLAAARDGSVYLLEYDYRNLRRIRPSGMIETVAASSGGWFRASDAIHDPSTIAAAPDGGVFLCDYNRVLHAWPDAPLQTIFGDDSYLRVQGGALPEKLPMCAGGMASAPDGSLVVLDSFGMFGVQTFNRLASPFPGFSVSEVVVPEEGGRVAYVFDGSGRHLRTLDAATKAVLGRFTYDTAGRLATMVDGDGNTTTVQRTSNGALSGILGPFGHRSAVTLNPSGQLWTVTDPANAASTFTYWPTGQLHTFLDPRGQTHTFEFDSNGLLTKDSGPDGFVKTLTRTEGASGWRVAVTTAMGQESTYTTALGAAGETTRVTKAPDGTKVTSVRKADGTTTATAADGTVVTTTETPDPRFGSSAPIDASTKITLPSGLSATATHTRSVTLANAQDPLSATFITDTTALNGNPVVQTYDVARKTVKWTTPMFRTITGTIDAHGRPLSLAIPGLNTSNFTYDAQGRWKSTTVGTRTTTATYDARGNLQTVTDALGRTTRLTPDGVGRITKAIASDGREISLTYASGGDISAIAPPGRQEHGFLYAASALPTDYVPPAIVGAGKTSFLYDADERLSRLTRPDASRLEPHFNALGQMDSLTTPAGAFTYHYEPTSGFNDSITTPDGTTTSVQHDGPLPTGTTWTGAIAGSVQQAFNKDFRLTSETVAGLPSVTFGYDADGILKVAGAEFLSTNPSNGLLSGTVLGSVSDSIGYSAYAELSSYSASYASSALYSAQYLERDALGRIKAKVEVVDGISTTYAYEYDAAGRLSTVRKNGILDATYVYDLNGNRITATTPSATLTGVFDAQDRMTAHGSSVFTYTPNGELRTKSANGLNSNYEYDAFGNLRRATLNNTTVIDYLYDGQLRRIGKKVNGLLVQGLLYRDRLKPVAELDGNGNLVSRFVYGSAPQVPDYMVKAGITYRILSDHVGSPRVVVNVASGQIVQRIDYDSWGNIVLDTAPGFQPFGFAGGIYDRDTQFVRFGARDYDPSTGRWTAKDPSGLRGGLNSFAYADCDPINKVDLTGFKAQWVARLVEISAHGFTTLKHLTFEQAVQALRNGEDVLAKNSNKARDIAKAAGGKGTCPVHDFAHKPGDPAYRPHYHAEGRPKGFGHSFYGLMPLFDLNGDGTTDWSDPAEIFAPILPAFPIFLLPGQAANQA